MTENKTWVKMLASAKDLHQDKTYEIDSETAKQYISLGIAEEITNPEEDLFGNVQKAIDDKINSAVEKIASAIKVKAAIPAHAKSEDETKCFGEYLGLIAKAGSKTPGNAYELLNNKYGSKVLTASGDGTAAGFTVPEDYRPEILKIDPYENVLWNSVKKLPTSTDTTRWPVKDQTVTPANGSSAFNGGMTVAFRNEGQAAAAESVTKFKQLTLEPKKITAYTSISREALMWGTGLQAELIADFRNEIASYGEYQVLNGSSQFTGLIDHAATIPIARNTAGTFKLADAAKMYSRFYGKQGLWVIHQYMIEKMIDNANFTSSSNSVSWMTDLNGKPYMSLLGFPVVSSQHCSEVGTPGDVLLIDPSKYLVAEGTDILISTSDHVEFLEDNVVFKVVYHVAGKPQIVAPITLADTTSIVSPYVQLDDYAS